MSEPGAEGAEAARRPGSLVFDVETRIDKALLNQWRYSALAIDDDEAYDRFRRERLERFGDDFAPVPLHVPISIAVGEVDTDHRLVALESLAVDGDRHGPAAEDELVRAFWRRVETRPGPLVSFNGRRFDLPVLELHALRLRLPLPMGFAPDGGGPPPAGGPAHLDLYEILTRRGTVRLTGGLDLLLRRIGHPGKGAVTGANVQRLWEEGRLDEVDAYCRGDVLATYLLFLRLSLGRGALSREREQALADEASRRFATT